MKIIWKDNKSKFSSGEFGFIGKWKIFEWNWNVTQSRNIPEKERFNYRLSCSLPGLKPDFLCKTQEEAKAKAESLFDYWEKGLTNG